MLSKKVETALNKQIEIEGQSSQFYLAMASWAEVNGLAGTAEFLYTHSDEERMHMLKLVKYVNERGGHAVIPALTQPPVKFKGVHAIFESLLKHEIFVSNEINKVVHICLGEKDYSTHNFMQWYVAEQIEEEGLARLIMDKLKLIGNDSGGMYIFDRDVVNLAATVSKDKGPQ
ncbi:MAG TPA: ferritin [Flavobacteriales bacterium]|nr:ferritin [Flavobacteriales bacterium]